MSELDVHHDIGTGLRRVNCGIELVCAQNEESIMVARQHKVRGKSFFSHTRCHGDRSLERLKMLFLHCGHSLDSRLFHVCSLDQLGSQFQWAYRCSGRGRLGR